MKLYATTTSERASKGQGGNKEIVICLNYGSRDNSQEVAQIIFTATEYGYDIALFDSEEEGTPRIWKTTKAKKQTGEWCKAHGCFITECPTDKDEQKYHQ